MLGSWNVRRLQLMRLCKSIEQGKRHAQGSRQIAGQTMRFSSLNVNPSDRESEVHRRKDAVINPTNVEAQRKSPEEKSGVLGGFMRGLIGGQTVAVEDAFIAEAKEQGVRIPQSPPRNTAALVPVKKRKREEEDASRSWTIRDRLFSRFAGSTFMQSALSAKERIAEHIDDSENPIINMIRNVYDRLFAENEMAMVVREICEEDTEFRISEFLTLVETDLVPKILGAYLRGDQAQLRNSCTEDSFAMLNASIRERDAEGIVIDSNILDIADVELTAGKVLEDSPVLIVSFNTQQINCLRDVKGNVIEGREDDIRAVYYAWAFVKEPEFEEFTPTGGGIGQNRGKTASDETDDAQCRENVEDKRQWKLMEMVIRGAHSTI